MSEDKLKLNRIVKLDKATAGEVYDIDTICGMPIWRIQELHKLFLDRGYDLSKGEDWTEVKKDCFGIVGEAVIKKINAAKSFNYPEAL